MKIHRCFYLVPLLLTGCASTNSTNVPLPVAAAETSIVSAAVVRAHIHTDPGCATATATRARVLEASTHNSFEEWLVVCGAKTNTYKVLVARLGGGVTADVVGDNIVPLAPSPDECAELKHMLTQAERSNKVPTPDLISAHQQVMYKTLSCSQ